MGDTSKVAVVVVGVVTLYFDGDKELVLHDCLDVPRIRRNLISVPCLTSNGYSTLFNKKSIFVKWNDDVICCSSLIDNMYLVDSITPIQINSNKSNHKIKEPSSVNQTQLWHLRLGHINLDTIRKLVTSGYLSPLDMTAL